MSGEPDPEHVIDFAFPPLGSGPDVTDGWNLERGIILVSIRLDAGIEPALDQQQIVAVAMKGEAGLVPVFRRQTGPFVAADVGRVGYDQVKTLLGQAVEQVSLKYVNTDLATLTGVEVYAEYDLRPEWTLFGNLSYVRGDDRTRNGNFATQPGAPGAPSQQVAGLDRGFFGGVSGEDSEPLPSILPLDSMVGVRWHSAEEIPTWGLEFYARIVDGQTRVAASLLESATPGFSTFNANGFWRYSDDLTFWFGAHNFTNTHYREHLDFRSPSGSSVFQPGAAFFFASELTY